MALRDFPCSLENSRTVPSGSGLVPEKFVKLSPFSRPVWSIRKPDGHFCFWSSSGMRAQTRRSWPGDFAERGLGILRVEGPALRQEKQSLAVDEV